MYRAARRDDAGALVAFKVLRVNEEGAAPANSMAELTEETQRELLSLQQCDSPHVIRYIGAFLFDGLLWIAMEYCRVSAQAVMRHSQQPFAEAEIAAVCAQALSGLHYLHAEKRLIHRDVKAANILLTEAGGVKLADFGVAAQVSGTLAKRSTVIGTPMWMSPEMIEVRRDGIGIGIDGTQREPPTRAPNESPNELLAGTDLMVWRIVRLVRAGGRV